MNFHLLERRRDPRTQAFVPITLRLHGAEDDTPAHLLDLSCGGAGVMTTAYNAPVVGEYLDLRFEMPNGDGGSERAPRQETGLVVGVHTPERGVARVSVRFLQHRGLGSGLFDPKDTLTTYRKRLPIEARNSRWEGPANAHNSSCSAPAVAVN